MRIVVLCAVCAGCFSKPTGDGAPEDAANPCASNWGPFQNPRLLAEIRTNGIENAPFLSQDGLELVFARERHLISATRSTPTGAFDTGIELTGGFNTGSEGDPWLSDDRLRMWFSTNEGGMPTIHVAFRTTSPTGPFSDAGAQFQFAGAGPELSSDELTIYYNAMGITGTQDLFMRTRAKKGDQFGTGFPLAVSTSGQDYSPSIGDDGTTLVWSVVASGSGAQHIVHAPIESVNVPGAARDDYGLNIGGYDFDPALSRDGSTLIFASTRAGDPDIYTIMRTCLPPI